MLFIRRPLALFLTLTFGWAWLFWGYWVFAMPPGGLVLSPAFLLTAIVGGLAPSLAALVVSRIDAGPGGAGRLIRQLTDWSASRWVYPLALLLAPAASGVGWLLAGTLYPLAAPDFLALLPVILIWPPLAALGEELGWRGWLYPRLRGGLGPLGAGLVIGLVWGVWHLPADFVGLKASIDWFWLAFLVNGPIVLTGHALVMAWLWERSGGSLVAMVLYHLGITAAAMAAPSPGAAPPDQIAVAAIGAATVWLIAIALHLAAPIRKT